MNCLFCEIIEGNIPSYKVFENEEVYAFLDVNPQSAGHTLVVPKQHCTNILDGELDFDMYMQIRNIALLLKEKLNFDGFKLQVNNEAIAGQEVMHLHFHIIPVYATPKHNQKEPATIIDLINV